MRITILLALLAFPTCGPRLLAGEANPLDRCNVVWDSPSKNSSGSMPIGNGDIGLNTWVEENGDLLLLISKTDAWCENSRIMKVGRVRIALSPSPFVKGQPFRQELKLREGMIEIAGGPAGAATVTRVWVDANRPVIRVECDWPQPYEVSARLEVWRTEKRLFDAKDMASCWHMNGVDGANRSKEIKLYVTPDTIVDGGERLVWYHRNEYSVWPTGLKLQGLESLQEKLADPLLNRTFGGAIFGKGLVKQDSRTLKSAQPAKSHSVSICVLTDQTPTPEAWVTRLDKTVQAAEAVGLAKARAAHQQHPRARPFHLQRRARPAFKQVIDQCLQLCLGSFHSQCQRHAGALTQVVHRAVGADSPVAQDGQRIDAMLKFGQYVGADHQSHAACAQRLELLVEITDRRWVQAGGGFVEQQQLGGPQQGLGEPQPLAHAFGIFAHRAQGSAREAHLL